MKQRTFQQIWQVLTPSDRVLYIVVVVLGIISLWLVQAAKKAGSEIIIEVEGKEIFRDSIAGDNRIVVNGPIGKTIVVIANGKVWVEHSDCPHKICVKSGKIHRAGDVIVCVPNKVVVQIRARKETTVDAVIG